jgi:hypothetical protein
MRGEGESVRGSEGELTIVLLDSLRKDITEAYWGAKLGEPARCGE